MAREPFWTKVKRSFDEDDPFGIKIDADGSLIQRYLEAEGPAKSLLASYDHFISTELPRIISSKVLSFGDYKVHLVEPRVHYPNIHSTGSKKEQVPLLPNYARLHRLSYLTSITAKLEIYKDGARHTFKDQEFNIGSIPVMLGSQVCRLKDLTEQQLINVGESPIDPFGYFVVDGNEYVVMVSERLERHRVFSYVKGSGDKKAMVTSITCKGNAGTKVFSLQIPTNNKNGKPILCNMSGIKNSFNVFGLFKYLGLDVAQVIALIENFIPKKHHGKMILFLHPTINSYRSSQIDVEPEKHLGVAAEFHNMDPGLLIPSLNALINDSLFPHINVKGDAEATKMEKIFMLIHCMVNFVEVNIGIRETSDRDGWGNKAVAMAGTTIGEGPFARLFNTAMEKVQTELNKEYAAFIKSHSEDLSSVGEVMKECIRCMKTLRSSMITDGMTKALKTGNFGATGAVRQSSMVEILNRLTAISVYSHISKLSLALEDNSRDLAPRLVNGRQLGYVCPVESPDGKKSGLNKNLACTASVTTDMNPEPIILRIRPFITELNKDRTDPNYRLVMVNGRILGWGDTAMIRKEVIKLRRSGDISVYTSVFIDKDGILYIRTNGSRLVRPLLVVEDGQILMKKKGLVNADWQTLLKEGCIEYIDALEQEHCFVAMSSSHMTNLHQERLTKLEILNTIRSAKEVLIAEERAEFARLKGEFGNKLWDSVKLMRQARKSNPQLAYAFSHWFSLQEQVKVYEDREAKIVKDLESIAHKQEFTHCEMDPIAIVGFTASIIPMIQRNQSPRNVYQSGMAKQAMGVPHINHANRMDTSAKILAYPSRPLFETYMEKVLGIADTPTGETVTVAILSQKGATQEDAFTFNKASIDRGKFRYFHYSTYRAVINKVNEENKIPSFERRVGKDDEDNDVGDQFQHIGEHGVPKKGAKLKEGDCVIAKVRKEDSKDSKGKNGRPARELDTSIYLQKGEEGEVDRVIISENANGNTVITVKLKVWHTPMVGNKFSPRYANKGTMSSIWNEEDMPFIAGAGAPDIIMNPHAIPSRMTIGMMEEILCTHASLFTGRRVNASAFRDKFDIEVYKEILAKNGFNRHGEQVMFDGTTGELIQADVFVGPCFFQALKHTVDGKIQGRSTGKVDILTRQPIKGRTKGGGLRFGEMETGALISHGAPFVLNERLLVSSDKFRFPLCATCGRVCTVNINEGVKIPTCKVCKRLKRETSFGTLKMPFAFMQMVNNLEGAGMKFTFKVREVRGN